MKQVVIENPILNSPFEEPRRQWRFTDEGITNEIVEARRISSYFVPIAKPRKRGKDKQLVFDTEWTQDRVEENKFINQVRGRVALWREGNYVGVTKTTRRLLEYWANPQRENKLFFCQIEALETAIYITEAARKCGDTWIENDIRDANESANPSLYRIAFKMATGSGKTVVMGMLIAWQAMNKFANSQDGRFSDTFLLVTPGITIRDRLRVLLPNDPNNYYRQRDLLPSDMMEQLLRTKIIITNFHAFMLREKIAAGKLTKNILSKGKAGAFQEAERQTLALLEHPNIAHVFDAGTTEAGRPYFVMEYVEGKSVTKYCDEHKLSVEERLELFKQICEGVHHAHQKGIIHRDIKPSNILVSVQDDKAVPKIIDFGIAKAITQPLAEKTSYTKQGQLLGTPEYMSPEQAEMSYQDVDTRSDIYSLGVVQLCNDQQ